MEPKARSTTCCARCTRAKPMTEESRLVTPLHTSDDDAFDRAVRPKSLEDYVGQPRVKAQMEIFITAARQREEALDHTLLFGPPGLGKTTLAHIIANELKVNLRQTSGPILERPGDLAAILTNLEPRDVLFIDEIHRLNPAVEEFLYPAMEDFKLDIIIGQVPSSKSVKIPVADFTLVGATTRAGSVNGCWSWGATAASPVAPAWPGAPSPTGAPTRPTTSPCA